MSRVVLIHGAFNELWGPHELKARWFPALQDGLWYHGVAIESDDVAACFYGDLFRLDPETLDVDEWRKSKAGAEDMLSNLGGDDAMEALSQVAGKAAYDRTVDMVATMAENPSIGEEMGQRLLEQLGGNTRVVVAHSLGTVVAHRTLTANPGIEVDTLVTLGSPLGSGFFSEQEESGQWPGSVRHWVNIAAVEDRVPDPEKLAARYGDRVEQHVIDNGHRAHDPEPYLNCRQTGAAVARGLQPR